MTARALALSILLGMGCSRENFQLALTISRQQGSQPDFTLRVQEVPQGGAVLSWAGGPQPSGQVNLNAQQLSQLESDLPQLETLPDPSPAQAEELFAKLEMNFHGQQIQHEEASGKIAKWFENNSQIGSYVRPGVQSIRALSAAEPAIASQPKTGGRTPTQGYDKECADRFWAKSQSLRDPQESLSAQILPGQPISGEVFQEVAGTLPNDPAIQESFAGFVLGIHTQLGIFAKKTSPVARRLGVQVELHPSGEPGYRLECHPSLSKQETALLLKELRSLPAPHSPTPFVFQYYGHLWAKRPPEP